MSIDWFYFFLGQTGLIVGLFAWLKSDIRDLSQTMRQVEKEISFIHGLLSPRAADQDTR